LLGIVGITALTVALVLSATRVLIHDESTVVNAVNAALDDPAVRVELEYEVARAIEHDMYGQTLSRALKGYGIDIAGEASRIAPLVIDDPAFRAALSDLIAEGHRRILLEPSDQPLETAALTDAVRNIVSTEAPQIGSMLPPNGNLLQISGEQIPDLTSPVAHLDDFIVAIALAGLALPLAALVHPRRHRVMAWTGRWLLVMGLISGFTAVVVPYVAGRITGYSLVEVAIRNLSTRLLGPASIAGVVGMGLVSAASILQNRERFKTTDEGAAAALGVDEPELNVSLSSPELDLARRGLVDVNHPLTSI